MHLRVIWRCFMAVLLSSAIPVNADTTTRAFEVYNAANGLADNSAQSVKCTRTGRLVISTMGQINFFDGHKFSYIDPSNENQYHLESYAGNYHLYFDKYHHLWLKNTHTVTCVNLTTEKFVESIEKVFAEFGVTDKVKDLYVDVDGVPYLITDAGLTSVESGRQFQLRKNHVLQDLETYDDKYLLLFYDNGEVDVHELTTGAMVFVGKSYGAEDYERYRNTSLVVRDGSSFYQLRNGSKEAILQRFDITKWEWKELMRQPYHLNNLELKDSMVYVPCEYGYWELNPATGERVQYDRLKMMRGSVLETNVNCMAFDRQGGMWLGTENRGLLYARPYKVPFKVYSWADPEALAYAIQMEHLPTSVTFQGRQVNTVFRDSRGWQWVGTSSGLMLYKEGQERVPTVFTRRDGLLNNVVHSIVEDRLHGIWVSTSFGISRVVMREDGGLKEIVSYDNYDFVPNESFVNGKAMCLADGTIVMQGLDHVMTFNPAEMHTLGGEMEFKIYPKLVKVMINGNEVNTGDEVDGKVILEKALSRTREINVSYDQNSLSLTFSALNYFRPRQTYYRLRVKEIDDTWKVFTPYNSGGIVDGKGQLHLPLVSLNPGTYTVEVQSSMSLDDWSSEPYVWTINVNEPWWRTSGIFALLGLVLLALVLVNAYFYVKNSRMVARRYGEELNVIRRIKSFVAPCYETDAELLQPTQEEMTSVAGFANYELSREFLLTMDKIKDTVRSKRTMQLSMQSLSAEAGMDLKTFYTLITSNIFKSPRGLVKHVMLERGAEMLAHSDKDLEDIALECRFVSANYFIASFLHEYGMLPEEYRRKHLK